jgi:predicted DNA-binding protein with PD1-like motif
MKEASAQRTDADYISPAAPVPTGNAPGMKVKLISESNGVKNYAVIFAKEDEVLSGINDFARKYKVTSARFTAVGALKGVTTGWLDLKKKMYKLNPINEQVELTSLIGDIGLYNGNPAVHSHITIGLPDGTARGGHLIEAHVNPTVELFVTVFPTTLEKTLDPETDLKLFELTKD